VEVDCAAEFTGEGVSLLRVKDEDSWITTKTVSVIEGLDWS
jgi:hypothetical protein